MAACSSTRRRPARRPRRRRLPRLRRPRCRPRHSRAGDAAARRTHRSRTRRYPTTRRLGATSEDRAADLNAAFADPTIRAVVATIGGDDQITVIPHLDGDLIRRDPKPFVGYSDNTNLHDWLWRQGVASFYGGSTQVHLGSGPGVDPEQAASLRAALLDGGVSSSPSPASPRTSASTGPTPGPSPTVVSVGHRAVDLGRPRGIRHRRDVGRMPRGAPVDPHGRPRSGRPRCARRRGLLVETSEELPTALEFGRILRSLGERGLLGAVNGVLVARPPASNFEVLPRPGRAGRVPRAAARHRDRGDRPLQPRSRGLRRRAVRPHPPAVDRAARRRGHARRRRAASLGRLPLNPTQAERMPGHRSTRRSASLPRRNQNSETMSPERKIPAS